MERIYRLASSLTLKLNSGAHLKFYRVHDAALRLSTGTTTIGHTQMRIRYLISNCDLRGITQKEDNRLDPSLFVAFFGDKHYGTF